MKDKLKSFRLGQVVTIPFVLALSLSSAFAQRPTDQPDPEAAQRAEHQEQLKKVQNDKSGYAEAIVKRWEESARASGRWDENHANHLFGALMNLQPENLARAGEAPSYEAMMLVLQTGKQIESSESQPSEDAAQATIASAGEVTPTAIGDTYRDLVYTPVTPCRIVDTRNAGGKLAANSIRTFDVDNPTSYSFQGGFNGSCGIPYGVARAVAVNITSTQSSSAGYFNAWGLGTQPFSTLVNFSAGQNIANAAIIPVVPGGGNDFSIFSSASSHVIVAVLGYFAAPTATALDCQTVAGTLVTAHYNTWINSDASCPAGYTATGGGYDIPEGSLGRPNIWVHTLPVGNGWRTWVDNQNSTDRRVQTYARCCRVPGR